MKKIYLIVGFFTLIFIVGILSMLVANNDSRARVENTDTNTVNNSPVVDIKASDEGGVVVEVQLIDMEEWKFDISLNTHTTDLSQDLTQVSVLTDENGNEYEPLAWEGDPPSGHHRSGILRFGKIDPKPQKATLTIREIGGVDARIFSWEL